MKRFYFFTSTRSNDSLSAINVFTDSLTKAFDYARKQFVKHGCKGEPKLIAI